MIMATHFLSYFCTKKIDWCVFVCVPFIFVSLLVAPMFNLPYVIRTQRIEARKMQSCSRVWPVSRAHEQN